MHVRSGRETCLIRWLEVGAAGLRPIGFARRAHGHGFVAFDIEIVGEVAASFAFDGSETVEFGGAFEQQAGSGLAACAGLAQYDQRGDEEGSDAAIGQTGFAGGVGEGAVNRDHGGLLVNQCRVEVRVHRRAVGTTARHSNSDRRQASAQAGTDRSGASRQDTVRSCARACGSRFAGSGASAMARRR
ncbi:MAG: hypothetical protein ABT22_07095 [Thiobacillus sp. SCN 64-317]|nr:MAG: hypothetical protein ABT22_07095 [Thiobacillus sp. SCN 64-317]